MSRLDAIADHVDEHGFGILTDLAFAIVWVTGVSVLFGVTDGPQWAYYLFMIAGVVAYFGFMGPIEE